MKNIKNTRTDKIHRICHAFDGDFYDSVCGIVSFGKGAMGPAIGKPDFRKCYELTNKKVTCLTCLRLLRSRANKKFREKRR